MCSLAIECEEEEGLFKATAVIIIHICHIIIHIRHIIIISIVNALTKLNKREGDAAAMRKSLCNLWEISTN